MSYPVRSHWLSISIFWRVHLAPFKKEPPFHSLNSSFKYHKIDRGFVLGCLIVPIDYKSSLASLHEKDFLVSTEAFFIQALGQVRTKDWEGAADSDLAPSYYSFSTKQNWTEFRARSGRFI